MLTGYWNPWVASLERSNIRVSELTTLLQEIVMTAAAQKDPVAGIVEFDKHASVYAG